MPRRPVALFFDDLSEEVSVARTDREKRRSGTSRIGLTQPAQPATGALRRASSTAMGPLTKQYVALGCVGLRWVDVLTTRCALW